MAIFEGKDGKKSFHMNPQQGKALKGGGDKKGGGLKGRGGGELSHGREDKLEESLVPGLHQKVEQAAEHKFMGHDKAHHVEIHHGGHTQGSPPAHEGHTHHTITHHQGHGGGGFGGGGKGDQFTEQGGLTEPTVTNHESFQEAMGHAGAAMHDGCPECEGTDVGHTQEPTEEAEYGGSSEDEGLPV